MAELLIRHQTSITQVYVQHAGDNVFICTKAYDRKSGEFSAAPSSIKPQSAAAAGDVGTLQVANKVRRQLAVSCKPAHMDSLLAKQSKLFKVSDQWRCCKWT